MGKPSRPFHIREMDKEDKVAVVALARSLAEFFPEDVVQLIAESLEKRPALVGVLGDEIVGFLVYTIRDAHTAEIVWMGVGKQYHGLGLGTLLLDTLEAHMEKKGVRKLVASTLSYTVQYKPFEKVRTFYYHRGFSSLGVQQNYYDDGMDRLLLVKNI